MPFKKPANTNHAYDSSANNNLNTYRASGMVDMQKNPGGIAITTTNIEVYSNGMKVGFIQSASPSESRNIVKVQELGTEGVVQSVPSNTNGGQLQLSRFALYNSTLFRALGLAPKGNYHNGYSDNQYNVGPNKNPFKTLKDQRVPLEIKIRTRIPVDYYKGSGGENYYDETYIDCWLSSYSKSIASNTITITEQATIQYSDVLVITPEAKVPRNNGKTTGETNMAQSEYATGRVKKPY